MSSLLSYSAVTVVVGFGIYKLFFGKKNMTMPLVEDGVPFLGQVFVMLKGSPWDTMTAWQGKYGMIYQVCFLSPRA